MIKYFKSFKEYIPTWVISIFMFVGIFGWTLVIAITLLIIQCIQRNKIKKKLERLDDGSYVDDEMQKLFDVIKGKDDTINELNDSVSKYQKEITILGNKLEQSSQDELEKDRIWQELENERNTLLNKIHELQAESDNNFSGGENLTESELILCEGNYVVGKDIPLGGYILKPKNNYNAYVRLYPSYNKFKKDEDEILYESFEGNYHITLIEDRTVLKVENADIYKTSDYSADTLKYEDELNDIKAEVQILNNDLIEKYYMFSNYDHITSQDCKNELTMLKQREKELREYDGDVCIEQSIENTKKTKDRTIRQMLRNFNSECDNIMSNITIKNIDKERNKIQKSFDTLNKLYSVDGVALSKELLELKLEQITLMYTYELKHEQELEIQKAIKDQMMEEAKAQRELEEQKKKIEKDLQQHIGEVNRMMKYLQKTEIDAEKQLYMDKIKELEDKIKVLESDKETVLERVENAKAGFVYIISNIGSFGEGIYKIGMTRRLEPMDRVKELSSASVPFEFDVHAMIFSSDAPELENILHKHFADRAVNKVNPRKEFFKVDIDEIEKIVKENYNDTVQFTKIPIAAEYRQSINV